jgi:hypothetical protein
MTQAWGCGFECGIVEDRARETRPATAYVRVGGHSIDGIYDYDYLETTRQAASYATVSGRGRKYRTQCWRDCLGLAVGRALTH